MAEALKLLCPCGDQFVIGTGDRSAPWKAPKDLTKQLSAWYDEHQACSVMRYPARPAIMVGVVE